MAVELHYAGRIYDLDPMEPDSFWVDFLDRERIRSDSEPNGLMTSIDLADGRSVSLRLVRGTPFAIVASRELFEERLR